MKRQRAGVQPLCYFLLLVWDSTCWNVGVTGIFLFHPRRARTGVLTLGPKAYLVSFFCLSLSLSLIFLLLFFFSDRGRDRWRKLRFPNACNSFSSGWSPIFHVSGRSPMSWAITTVSQSPCWTQKQPDIEPRPFSMRHKCPKLCLALDQIPMI